MLLSEHKKANMFKAKRLIEKGVTDYLNQVPWSPQQTIPDHRLHLSMQLQKFLSRTYSRFLYMSLCACVCVCVCVCVSEWVSVWVCVFVYVSECVFKGETCWYSVNTFGWITFRAIWKGRGGGQELSAEVKRSPGWGSWYPPFRSVFLL